MKRQRATPPCKGWDDLKPLTEDQIKALDDQQLSALARSITPVGRYAEQYAWAQGEMARRRVPYVSTAAQQFAPGNFVTEGTSDKVGVTRAIADKTEANPLVLVKWMRDLTEEWVRAEYLYRAN